MIGRLRAGFLVGWTVVAAGAAVVVAGCGGTDDASGSASDSESVTVSTAALGGFIGNITAAEFAEAKANFNQIEGIDDGVGPVFNERACGTCHSEGTSGGSGVQIERRFGRFVNGAFDPIADKGGSLRQLFSLGSFVAASGSQCNIPVESEPPETTVHNVGRLTTPLFGLGLVDAMPDSFFDLLASLEPSSVRGVVNRVQVVLPNPGDPSQHIGSTRVARFGWKAGVPTLSQFAADAYLNEMGITTQHCIGGVSVTAFSTESAPNGVPAAPGCDDLAKPAPPGVPAGTDDAVGACDGNKTELQEDVENFRKFMTHLAPPPPGAVTLAGVRGAGDFANAGCTSCHTPIPFVTPKSPANGVPGGMTFFPFSDFLAHDMGTLGDRIGNPGDSEAVTRRMRTAPLWGIRFRSHLLHDGRTGDVAAAIRAHDGQGAAARNAFNALSASKQSDLVAFVKTL